MSTTTFSHILIYLTDQRASGITVASQPIPQFTESNNFRIMKSDLETTRMLSRASYLGFHMCITVTWRCTSHTTIFSSVSMAIIFDFEHNISLSIAWPPFQTSMEDIFQHPKLVRVLSCFGWKIFLRLAFPTAVTSRSSAPLRVATHG
jgi:hypothetical protein